MSASTLGGLRFRYLIDKKFGGYAVDGPRDPEQILSNYASLDDVRNGALVLRCDKGGYRLFKEQADYWKWRETLPENERVCQEVCFGELPQRLKFDIDATAEMLDSVSEDVFVRLMPGRAIATKSANRAPDVHAQRLRKAEMVLVYLASLIVDVFEMRYSKTQHRIAPEDLLVMSSLGPSPVAKYSYHILAMPVAIANNREAKDFTAQVIAEMRGEAPELAMLLDPNVNSSTQCFRLPGSQKAGSGRTKVIDPALNKRIGTFARELEMPDALVQMPVLEGKVRVLPPLLTQQDLQPTSEALTDDDERKIVEHIMQHSASADAHVLKRRLGSLFVFERTKPSMCALCDRVHHNENSLMVTACPSIS